MGLLSKLFLRNDSVERKDFFEEDGSEPQLSPSQVVEMVDGHLKAAASGSVEAEEELDRLSNNPSMYRMYSEGKGVEEWVARDYYESEFIGKGFPWAPATDDEYNLSFNSLNKNLFLNLNGRVVLTDYPGAITGALFRYGFQGDKNYHPLKIWHLMRTLKHRAVADDPVALYALLHFFPSEELQFLDLPKEEKEAIRVRVSQLASEGNVWAKYAAGLMAGSWTREKFALLLEAAEAGNANAAYDLIDELNICAFPAAGVQDGYKKLVWAYELGAKAREGVQLGYLQHSYGEYFDEGEAVLVDYNTAVFWQTKAAGNGSSLAQSTLNYLREHEADIRAKDGTGEVVEQPSIESIRQLYDSGAVEEGRKQLFGK